MEILEGIGIVVLFVLGALLALAIAAVCIAVILAIVAAAAAIMMIRYLIELPGSYAVVMFTAVDNELRKKHSNDRSRVESFLRLAAHRDRNVALPSYFFGPAEIDFRQIFFLACEKTQEKVSNGWELAGETFGGEPSFFCMPAGIGMGAGTAAGAILGLIAAAVMAITHLIVIAMSAVSALLTCGIMKTADLLIRLARNIRMTCPICALNVRPYPVYKCRKCGALHHEIRPGPRGVSIRTCICGARLPTLIVTGTTRLTALCPRCNCELPPRFGKVPEAIIPFFGSIKAGKTQLIYVLIKTLQTLVDANAGHIELFGDTRDRLERIGEQIRTTGGPAKTVAQPQTYILRITVGSSERLVYLFDAAGELHYRFAGLERMAYLDKARTMVFVADPLASDSIWAELSEEQRVELANVRSRAEETEVAYQMTREQMRQSEHPGYAKHLGFVVSKADLLGDTWAHRSQSGSDVRELVDQHSGMNMGNLVREAAHSFSDVQFFKTSAALDKHGRPDDSIKALALWLIRLEGIELDRTKKGRKLLPAVASGGRDGHMLRVFTGHRPSDLPTDMTGGAPEAS